MKTKKLHHLELEVMKAVWKQGQATVNDVLDNIDRKLAYTTVDHEKPREERFIVASS